MYFEDLTPYSYNLPKALSDVLNIGWLASDHDYTMGSVSQDFMSKLTLLIVELKTNLARGYHECDFCRTDARETIPFQGSTIYLGSAEIWVPSVDGTVIYAAPSLIYHYISDHNYCPPLDFIEAAGNYSLDRGWDVAVERNRRVSPLYGNK